ncbi:MAG TPA: sigma-70 family RNA polymerase sigma factor [Gemmataceae bacterium]|nr:sigma-70 family RNA polymerase sigma factor [Gemmataceae bacterium]
MDFRAPALKELTDQQVRFAPAARRREQVARAAKLLGELDPAKVYPYQFVCFRITDYRPDAHGDLLIPAGDLKHDLAEFIRRVERSIPPLPIEQAVEPILTLEEVSKRLNVSTKTIGRWRIRGLVGQRVIVKGRRQIGFPRSMLDRFLEEHSSLVERGSNFSRLGDEERDTILYRARRLAQAGGDITTVSRRLARRLSRSVEAIRYTIKNFDRAHPDQAIFPDRKGPLDAPTKEMIFDQYERGIPVGTLTKKYERSRTAVYQAINEVQARRLLDQPIEYIHNEAFENAANDADFMKPMPNEEHFTTQSRNMTPPKDVPAEMVHLYRWPLLNKEQEQHLFRQMNYLKYKLNKLRQSTGPGAMKVGDLRQIEDLQARVRWVRDRLINCNTRLVASIAKKHAGTFDNLPELMSDGTISLMRAVEKFDYGRGNKFSTYATWAIMKNFARSIPDEKHHRERYVTGHEEMFEGRQDVRTDEQEIVAQADMARSRVNNLLDGLDARTREVIRMRNGLDGSAEMTLEQIGQHFGITKERVRQINVRGMKQLRDKAQVGKAEL